MTNKEVRIGIDVGLYSVGLTAIEVSSDGTPERILNSVVYVHDSGVDPTAASGSPSRLATAGVARRVRRMLAQRKKRYHKLDNFLEQEGFPLPNLEDYRDPYFPWEARVALVEEKLGAEEFKEFFAIAVRHMIRHRGWRNPYQEVRTLHIPAEESKEFSNLKKRIAKKIPGIEFSEDATVAEVVYDAVVNGEKLRGDKGLLGGMLRQSDNANELRKIAKVQGLDESFINNVIDFVFAAKSPKGAASKNSGMDTLPGQEKKRRAPKASLYFQKFRIVAVLSNVRIADLETGELSPLGKAEINDLTDYLMNTVFKEKVTWEGIAHRLGVAREQLHGTATEFSDGEGVIANPAVNVTHHIISRIGIKLLRDWWEEASFEYRNTLVMMLLNSEDPDENLPGYDEVVSLFEQLEDTDFATLDAIKWPQGRSAYSDDSLNRLTQRMLSDGEGLFAALTTEFDVPNDWQPPADPMGKPIGNPAVDRVLKIVNRWMLGVVRKYGVPSVVNIENVRDAFNSKELNIETNSRNKTRNEAIDKAITGNQEFSGGVTHSDRTRYLAVRRQNSCCAYCGEKISFASCQMDHIVPRKGPGSTNTRNNLLAVCQPCNLSKSNLPFAVWAKSGIKPGVSIEEAIKRVDQWLVDPELDPEIIDKRKNNFEWRDYWERSWKSFKDSVKFRLKTESFDEEIDNRSIESVAWMARELRSRIEWHFKREGNAVKVNVFSGTVTYAARRFNGFEYRVNFIGSKGKTRLDRRHHALDAAVVALMNNTVAKIFLERNEISKAQNLKRLPATWKEHFGNEHEAIIFNKWMRDMRVMLELFNNMLDADQIPVMQQRRLKLSRGLIHEQVKSFWYKKPESKNKSKPTIREYYPVKKLGDSWTLSEINRASTPQLWTALCRCPDFDPEQGLPENSQRNIRVKGRYFSAEDAIEIFPAEGAFISVRDGYASTGGAIHHARVYKIHGKTPKYALMRVFAVDLLRSGNCDLFKVSLPESSISMRIVGKSLKLALKEGKAEYVGALVAGDEIEVEFPSEILGEKLFIAKFLSEFPTVNRYVVAGFPETDRLKLRPRFLSEEGYKGDDVAVESILGDDGWRVRINSLFRYNFVKVVRREATGEVRPNHLRDIRFSWQVSNQ